MNCDPFRGSGAFPFWRVGSVVCSPTSSRFLDTLAFSYRNHICPASAPQSIFVHCELHGGQVNVDYVALHVVAAFVAAVGVDTADVKGAAADVVRNVAVDAVTGVVGVDVMGVVGVERSVAADVVISVAVVDVVDVDVVMDAVDELGVGVMMGVAAMGVVGVVTGVAGADVMGVVKGATSVAVPDAVGVARDARGADPGVDVAAAGDAWTDGAHPAEFVWPPSAGATELNCAAFQNCRACDSSLY